MASVPPFLRTPTLLLALALALPSAAAAQQEIRGRVSEGGAATPVFGAMVVLLDASEATVQRVLTRQDGLYRLVVAEPGRYLLRVDRLGYVSTYTEPFDVAAGAVVVKDVETVVDAVVLPGIEVEGSGRCEVRPGEGGATAVLWEEARKALDAASWTAERGIYRFAWTRYVRELGPDGRSVISESREPRAERLPTPFASLDAELLAREGFLRDEGGVLTYAAPDATVLLSDAFIDTHCFAIEPPPESGDPRVGLRFEPVRGRDVTEVEGVLWLNADDGRLVSLEYRYVNLPWRDADRAAGGELAFRALPNGTWIVDAWSIRMPRLVEVRNRAGQFEQHDITGFRVEGSVIDVVANEEGDVVSRRAASGVLRGTVADSLGRPIEGARVWVGGTALETRSGAEGTFAFEGLADGLWSVAASVPALEPFGHPGAVALVELTGAGVATTEVRLPSVADVVLGRCADEGAPDLGGALTGTVRDAAGRAVPGAMVRALWAAASGAARGAQEGVGVESDATGRFRICGVPAGRAVRAWVEVGDDESPVLLAEIPASGGVARLDLALPADDLDVVTEPSDPSGLGAEEAAWLASKGYELRAVGALLHETRGEIVGRGLLTLERVLTEHPRIEAREAANGRIEFRLHATEGWRADPLASPSCPVEFYLNGSLVRANRPALVDDIDPALRDAVQYRPLDLDVWIRPEILTAIELFDGGEAPVPVPGGCAVALLWVVRLEHEDDPPFDARLGGRVVKSDGTPIAGALVRLRPGEGEGTTDGSGYFDFGFLAPARYRVEVEVPGAGSWVTEILLRLGDVAEVTVEATPGG